MNAQKRRAIELAHRFKRRYDAQLLQAKIDYMASLHAPCVLAVVGDEVYAYNSNAAAFMAHGWLDTYYIGVYTNTYRDRLAHYEMRVSVWVELHVAGAGTCCHYNGNLCSCSDATGEYWIATPLADGTIELTSVCHD